MCIVDEGVQCNQSLLIYPKVLKKNKKELLLQQRGDPEDDDGAYDGGAELAEETTPLDAQQREQPAAKGSTEETENEVHDEAKATTLHQLAGTEASETSNND